MGRDHLHGITPSVSVWTRARGNHRSATSLVAFAVLLVTATIGCGSSRSRQIQIESAAAVKPYNAVTINYRVDAGQRGLPMQLARPEGQQVTFQQSPSSPYPNRSIGTLSIQYPHPDGRTDHALAELIIENDPGGPDATATDNGWFGWLGSVKRAARDNLPGIKLDDGVREAWAMDVPRREIDRVLGRLGATGYFTPTAMAPQGVKLATKIDGSKINKSWMQVPELDALAQRIRDRGKLVSYMRPQGYVDPFAEPPLTAPYGNMAAQTAMTGQTPRYGMVAPPPVPNVAPWMAGQVPLGYAAPVMAPGAGYVSMPAGVQGYIPMMETNPFAAPPGYAPPPQTAMQPNFGSRPAAVIQPNSAAQARNFAPLYPPSQPSAYSMPVARPGAYNMPVVPPPAWAQPYPAYGANNGHPQRMQQPSNAGRGW